MNAKLLLYVFIIPLVMWAISGLNINHLFKKNHVMEARVIYVILGFIISYLLVNFICDFTNI